MTDRELGAVLSRGGPGVHIRGVVWAGCRDAGADDAAVGSGLPARPFPVGLQGPVVKLPLQFFAAVLLGFTAGVLTGFDVAPLPTLLMLGSLAFIPSRDDWEQR